MNDVFEGRSLADTHVHLDIHDGLTDPAQCLMLAEAANLNIVVPADHNRINRALEALRLAQEREHKVSVIPGIEITTLEGHLLALFPPGITAVETPPGYKFDQTVKMIHDKGALAVIPHIGLGPSTFSVSPNTLDAFYQLGGKVEGMEIMHPNFTQGHAEQAKKISIEKQISGLGGSDDHVGNLGRGPITLYPGITVKDFLESINRGTTIAIRSREGPLNISLARQLLHLLKTQGPGSDLPIILSSIVRLQREQYRRMVQGK